MNNKIGSYKSAETIGKSQIDLILKVYDGTVASLTSAREAYANDQFADGREHMEKTKRFVTHLYTTLNMDKGGEVAENLSKLYSYVISQTYVIQATKDVELIDDMITIMENLRSGWRGLKEQQAEGEIPESMPEAQATTETAREFTTTA
ncbi:hypothetical protein GF356_06615 [candidate division GN15 bacterium]|nr:hypothetical protein [candidate division GN15 bacterium]